MFRPDKPWKQSRERKVAVSWHRGACGRLCRGSDRGRERTPEENRNKSGAQWPDWSSGQLRETKVAVSRYRGSCGSQCRGSGRGREKTPEDNRNKSGAQWPDWSSRKNVLKTAIEECRRKVVTADRQCGRFADVKVTCTPRSVSALVEHDKAWLKKLQETPSKVRNRANPWWQNTSERGSLQKFNGY